MKIKSIAGKNLTKNICIIFAVCTVICALLILAFHADFLSDFVFRAQDNVFLYHPDQIDEDLAYRIDLYNIFDCYAEDDEGFYYITNIDDTDGTKYMGIYAYQDQEEAFDSLYYSTWDYIENNIDDNNHLQGRCYIYDMGDREKELFLKYFDEYGIDRSQLVTKTLVFLPTWPTVWEELDRIIIGCAIVILVSLLLFVIRPTIVNSGKIKKCCDRYGLKREHIDRDVVSGSLRSDCILGLTMLVYIPSTLAAVIPYDRIKEVRLITNRTKNGVYYQIHVWDEDHTNYIIPVANRFEGERLESELIKRSININADLSQTL